MTEKLKYEQVKTMDLPRNPFARHKVVKGLISELQMPGVEVHYMRLPLLGRRDLEEHVIARNAAEGVYDEYPQPTEDVIFGTLRGSIRVSPRLGDKS